MYYQMMTYLSFFHFFFTSLVLLRIWTILEVACVFVFIILSKDSGFNFKVHVTYFEVHLKFVSDPIYIFHTKNFQITCNQGICLYTFINVFILDVKGSKLQVCFDKFSLKCIFWKRRKHK